MTEERKKEIENLILKEDEQGFLQFLQKTSPKDRRALIPVFRHMLKYYFEFIETEGKWGTRGGNFKHKNLIARGYFVCGNRSEYTRLEDKFISYNEICEIFKFHIPSWFTQYIIDETISTGRAPFGLDYDLMIDLKKNFNIGSTPELLAHLLVDFIFITYREDKIEFKKDDSKLLIYPETINEHIWHLFEYETKMHTSDKYFFFETVEEGFESTWKNTFLNFTASGKLDRMKVLKSCVEAINRNFNKLANAYFIDLYESLKPTIEEELKLQNELLSALHSIHSKSASTALKSIKNICMHPSFNTDLFIENANAVLTSQVKSLVNSALSVFGKIAKGNANDRIQLAQMSVTALMHNDVTLQKNTAKFILKYGDKNSEELRNEISLYQNDLLFETKELLKEYIQKENDEGIGNYLSIDQLPPVISKENKINILDSIDNVFFLASESFESNLLSIDLLPEYLIKFNPQINEENIERFEPALQRAFKSFSQWQSEKNSEFNDALCLFFINYIHIFILRFPKHTLKLQALFKNYRDEYYKTKYDHKQTGLSFIPYKERYGSYAQDHSAPLFRKLNSALKIIEGNIALPLLSTPTHHPFWIDAEILIEKLLIWQSSGVKPYSEDVQLAISRLYIKNTENKALSSLNELKGELKYLLNFVLKSESPKPSAIQNSIFWQTACITKGISEEESKSLLGPSFKMNQYCGDINWEVKEEPFKKDVYDYYKDYYRQYSPKGTIFKIQPVTSLNSSPPELNDDFMLYNTLLHTIKVGTSLSLDVERLYSIYPNNPELLIKQIIEKVFRHPKFYISDDINTITILLNQLFHKASIFGKMSHLLVASSLLCADKSVRMLAAELWIQANTKNYIDNKQIGEILINFFNPKFYPIKRLTDQIGESMFKLSKQHDMQLILLLENCLLHLDANITGTKKVLEIYMNY